MPQIAAYDEVKANRKQREIPTGTAWRTPFLTPAEDVKNDPVAFLVEGTPRRVIRPHYHEHDQFQVVVSGGGVLGKNRLAAHAVHFSRAYTPYGPIVFDEGLGFLTLRSQWDRGAQYMPDSRETLTRVPNRKPWQVTELGDFSGSNDVNLHEFSRIKDERGLAAFSISLKPGATATAPDPSRTAGQYIIGTRGSLRHEGKEYKALTIAFLKPHEAPMQLVAGPQGLEVLVLNYPRHEPAAGEPVAAKSPQYPPEFPPEYRIWQCQFCSFTYDEARGMPEEGVAPGTRWEEVPDTWSCPDCAASKSDFEMQVVG